MTGIGFKKAAGLGNTADAIMLELAEIIPFAPASDGTPASGQPRVFCKSENGLNTIEFIGDVQNPQSVALITAMTEDAIANIQNTTLMIKLLQLVIPQWQDQDAWLKTAAGRATKVPVKTTKHNKAVSLCCPSPGVLILSVG